MEEIGIMNRYDEPMGQNRNSEDAFTKLRNIERNEEELLRRNHNSEVEATLTEEQIEQLKEKYDLLHMTCEEQELLMKELYGIGILTKEECATFSVTGENIFESLKKQVSSNINLLYQMAIAGRDSGLPIEHIKCQQKILGILEQLLAG